MAERPPRAIAGSAGSRIKVLLGSEGSDYLLLMDEDDGDSEWQTQDWTTDEGGLPNGLAKQINACSAKGRYVSDVAFGPNNEWFVTGKKRDGSGEYSWWGGTDAPPFKELCGGLRVQAAFGDNDRYVVLVGINGHACWDVDDDLLSRIERIRKNKNEINFVRLFPNGGYFISDSDLDTHISDELEKGGRDPILDVSVAGDGSWIVIRPTRFTASTASAKYYNRSSQNSIGHTRVVSSREALR
jgi:hypothetical protein